MSVRAEFKENSLNVFVNDVMVHEQPFCPVSLTSGTAAPWESEQQALQWFEDNLQTMYENQLAAARDTQPE